MTTFGRRIDSVYLALESIADGAVLPGRLILWLDDPHAFENLPSSLQRMADRGLEIRLTDNIGSHSKYWPALAIAQQDSLPLVTADDDVIYPSRWLEPLLSTAASHPRTVVCHNAHRVTFGPGGQLLPYVDWERNWTTETSSRTFPLGVSGVLYPPLMIDELRARGQGFVDCTPRADDVWLHYVAASARIPARQISAIPTNFASVGDEGPSLSEDNLGGGGNDTQIAATYDDETLEWIRSQP